MTRRSFVLALLAGLGLAAGATWRLTRGNDAETIEAVVRKKLGYLKLDPEGLRRFAGDLAERRLISRSRLRVLRAAGPLYMRLALDGDNFLAHAVLHGEERITTLYLLSSDFFINQADESRTVRYLGYYDPLRACANPFARRAMDEPAATA